MWQVRQSLGGGGDVRDKETKFQRLNLLRDSWVSLLTLGRKQTSDFIVTSSD